MQDDSKRGAGVCNAPAKLCHTFVILSNVDHLLCVDQFNLAAALLSGQQRGHPPCETRISIPNSVSGNMAPTQLFLIEASRPCYIPC